MLLNNFSYTFLFSIVIDFITVLFYYNSLNSFLPLLIDSNALAFWFSFSFEVSQFSARLVSFCCFLFVFFFVIYYWPYCFIILLLLFWILPSELFNSELNTSVITCMSVFHLSDKIGNYMKWWNKKHNHQRKKD